MCCFHIRIIPMNISLLFDLVIHVGALLGWNQLQLYCSWQKVPAIESIINYNAQHTAPFVMYM